MILSKLYCRLALLRARTAVGQPLVRYGLRSSHEQSVKIGRRQQSQQLRHGCRDRQKRRRAARMRPGASFGRLRSILCVPEGVCGASFGRLWCIIWASEEHPLDVWDVLKSSKYNWHFYNGFVRAWDQSDLPPSPWRERFRLSLHLKCKSQRWRPGLIFCFRLFRFLKCHLHCNEQLR